MHFSTSGLECVAAALARLGWGMNCIALHFIPLACEAHQREEGAFQRVFFSLLPKQCTFPTLQYVRSFFYFTNAVVNFHGNAPRLVVFAGDANCQLLAFEGCEKNGVQS